MGLPAHTPVEVLWIDERTGIDGGSYRNSMTSRARGRLSESPIVQWDKRVSIASVTYPPTCRTELIAAPSNLAF